MLSHWLQDLLQLRHLRLLQDSRTGRLDEQTGLLRRCRARHTEEWTVVNVHKQLLILGASGG